MHRVIGFARRVFGLGAGLSMALVFLVIFCNSLRRYTLGRSVPWGEELPIYLTIYGVMFGLALGYLSDSHIRFTLVIDMLSDRVRRALLIGSDAVTIIAGAALAWAGHAFAMRRGDVTASGLKSTADALASWAGIDALSWLGRVGPYQYAIAFGGALLALAATLKLAERLTTPAEE